MKLEVTRTDLYVEVCRVDPPGSLFDGTHLWYDGVNHRWRTMGWVNFQHECGPRHTPEELLEYVRELRQELTQAT